MSKQIRFSVGGKEYILEYTRKTVEQMERNGFLASDINDKPVSTLPKLFAGAFMANHPYISRTVVDEIFAKMTIRSELIGMLAEMYNEPIATLVNEPEADEGNVDWTASW